VNLKNARCNNKDSVTLLILSKLNRILVSSGYIKAGNTTQSTFHEARGIFIEDTSSILPQSVSNTRITQKLSHQIIFYVRLNRSQTEEWHRNHSLYSRATLFHAGPSFPTALCQLETTTVVVAGRNRVRSVDVTSHGM
jgi:hypothetical protein